MSLSGIITNGTPSRSQNECRPGAFTNHLIAESAPAEAAVRHAAQAVCQCECQNAVVTLQVTTIIMV